MKFLILIEPKTGGGFRATVGEPFRLSAESDSEEGATKQLTSLIRDRLRGSRVAILDIESGALAERPKLQFEPIPGEDEFWDEFQKHIEENRRLADEAQG